MKEYVFLSRNDCDDMARDVNALAAQGYIVRHMTQSQDDHAIYYTVCLEREVEG